MTRFSKKYRPYEFWAKALKGNELLHIYAFAWDLEEFGMKRYQIISLQQEVEKRLAKGEEYF